MHRDACFPTATPGGPDDSAQWTLCFSIGVAAESSGSQSDKRYWTDPLVARQHRRFSGKANRVGNIDRGKSSVPPAWFFCHWVLVAVFVLGVLASASPVWAGVDPAAAVAKASNATPNDVDELREIEKKFEKVAAEAVKSVVGIQIGPSRGSGVITSADGLILTAGHVAQKPGAAATITTSDGKTFKGVSLGVFLSADAGMMKITEKGKWPCLELAAKGATRVGDWCLAVGHPLGYLKGRLPVVRMGRVLHIEDRTIQTDCPLIVGDSGGPLVNLDGKLIGINSRISGPMSMNYHVSADVFCQWWDRLKKGDIWTDGTLRDDAKVKAVFRKVVAQTAQCVVRIRCDKKDAVLGTIVGPDGWILTKASELRGRVVVRLHDGRDLEARTVGVNPRFDLAMLKIDAVDLPKISWQLKDPEVGQWVAVPGLDEDPLAIGVISVPRRRIAFEKGMLGVVVVETKDGVTISSVVPASPAAKAGLQKNDVITHLNGKLLKKQDELTGAMKRFRPGTTIKLTIKRGEETLEKSATLGKLSTPATRKRDQLNATGVGISRRHDDFPMVLQHDGTVRPADCGGPLVTLDGKAVGVNVARGGRTETYCIPANALVVLMYDLMSGRLRPDSAEETKSTEAETPEAEPKKEEPKKEEPKKEEPKKPATSKEKKKTPTPKSEPKPEVKPAPKEESKPELPQESKPAPKEKARPESKPAPKEESRPEAKAAPKEASKAASKPARKEKAKSEAKPASTPEQEAKPAPKEEPKATPKAQPKPEVKQSPKAEPRPEARPAPKEKPKPEPKPAPNDGPNPESSEAS